MFNPMRDRASQLGDRINWRFWRSVLFLVLTIAGLAGYLAFYVTHDCYQTSHILYWSSTTSCTRYSKSAPVRCTTTTYPVYETKCRR